MRKGLIFTAIAVFLVAFTAFVFINTRSSGKDILLQYIIASASELKQTIVASGKVVPQQT